MRKILTTIAARFGFEPKQSRPQESIWPVKSRDGGQRDFAAGLQTRLTADWNATNTDPDSEIRTHLKTLRNRSRDHERNSDYYRRYLDLVCNNVLGSAGIQLQMKIKEVQRAKSGRFTEVYDTLANRAIENAWWEWGKPQNCTVHKCLSWVDVQHIVLRSTVRDGAHLIRYHMPADNPFRFALELIESDRLDIDHNVRLENGNYVSVGIEFNPFGAPVAYHILRDHPGATGAVRTMHGKWRERVPREQLLHVYRTERAGQSTGFPWGASSMLGLKHLGAYTEAEVIAARMGAAKMGFLVNTLPTAAGGYTGETDTKGNKYMEAEPGSIEQLPYGYDFKSFDPTHPNSQFGTFVKAKLREISAGLNVSYTSLANDLESVNYSSIRAGLQDEREGYKRVQGWNIDQFATPVFENWLKNALAFGAVKSDTGGALPATRFEKFNAPEFKARRWDWVDPLADMQASVLAVEKGFKSRRQIISEQGGDIEDVFNDIAADNDLAEASGLDFSPESGEQANQQQAKPDKPDDVDKGKEAKA